MENRWYTGHCRISHCSATREGIPVMTDELFLKRLETISARLCTDYAMLMNQYRSCTKDTVSEEIKQSLDAMWQARLSVTRAIHHHNNPDSI
ncbi:hypothetical protein [Nostoc sp.]|uniref:hypothetical protein n=1 Tax=Nostoc sp. TaxID=1180 RepID=UPI002FF41037